MSVNSGWDNVIKAERERLGMDTPAKKVEAKAVAESNDNNVVPMAKKPRVKKAPKK